MNGGGVFSKMLGSSMTSPPTFQNGSEIRRPSSAMNVKAMSRVESNNGGGPANAKLAVSFSGKPTNASMTDLIGAPVFDKGG